MGLWSALLGPACASAPAWRAGTEGAVLLNPTRLEGVEKRIAGLPGGTRDKVEAALSQAAGAEASAAGVAGAIATIRAGLSAVEDPGWAGNGRAPAQAALLDGGVCVLHGLLARAGAAVAAGPAPAAGALAMVGEVEGLAEVDEGMRASLLDELRASLGMELYLAAWKGLHPVGEP